MTKKEKPQPMGLFDIFDQYLAQSLGVDVETYIEVIGNIYENPELLKDKQ